MTKKQILLLLDAHVEVSEGWLESLIARVTADRTVVVAPIISDETFEYVTASDTTWGGFNWHLNFRWYPVSDREMKRRNWDVDNMDMIFMTLSIYEVYQKAILKNIAVEGQKIDNKSKEADVEMQQLLIKDTKNKMTNTV